MNRNAIARAALASLSLGCATIACTPSAQLDHAASASDAAGRAGSRDAERARAALARHDGAAAVRFAERAVAAAPASAERRMVLGQAYLAAGRFASAETAFRDTLSIAPDQSRARFDLALTQVALDRAEEARGTLSALKGRIGDGDLGLALALAGDRAGGIAMLSDVVRAGQSDARVRQNLALAFALDGRWAEARGMAMQDTPPDRINDRVASFATLASANTGAARVAAMLGTSAVAVDPGQPARLALGAPADDRRLALAAPVAPTPVPAAAPADIPAPVMVADAAPIAPAMPPVVPAMLAAAPAPAAAASMPLAGPRAAPFVRVAARPRVAPGRIVHGFDQGGFVVQLGAFARSGSLDTAWAQASRLSPRVATFTPVSGTIAHGGATLMRLAVGGFADRGSATALCTQIRARGGACFVRASGGDAPAEWVRRDQPTRVAMG